MSAAATIRRWRSRPVDFIAENFGIEPDAWQSDALGSLSATGVNRLCLKACAGPGKTAVLAWLGWWWLSCFGGLGEHPKGIAVGVTEDNLRSNLWPELAKWQQRSPFLKSAFTWQRERVFANDHPETWFLAARSFPRTADPSEQGRVLSGLHSEYPFVLIDESGDIAPAIGRAAEQAMGNCKAGLIVQAGNPTSQKGLLYDSAVTRRESWRVTTITADPDDERRTPRVSAEWAREQIERYGRDNPWVQAYILGQFPSSALNALLSAQQVEGRLGAHLIAHQYDFAAKIIGVDVARFGDDRTVIFRRQGMASFAPEVMRGARTETIAGRVAATALEWGADAIFVDGSGGYGGGVVDALRLAKFDPIEVQFAGSPNDPRFINKRAEMWWDLAEWVKGGGALPPVSEIVAELSEPTYWLSRGKLQIEEKEQIKKRLGRSPDLADALALTFAQPIMPKSLRRDPASRRRAADYDPYARK